MILLIGAKGNMGRRYSLILKHLGEDVREVDLGDRLDASGCKAIVIATPTPTHYELIKHCAGYGLPILCEKPITQSLKELEELLELPMPLAMINQYRHISSDAENRPSYYNYFKTGGDGLGWDCINILGLANDAVEVASDAFIWECTINGSTVKIENMDMAYLMELRDWLSTYRDDREYIIKAHTRAAKWRAS